MNISKFLLIDAALAIAVFTILFVLKAKKISLFRNSNVNDSLEKAIYKLPNKKKLIELEKIATIKGSGIEFNSLVGDWKFVSIWEQDTDKEDSIFSSLLRFFSANLALTNDISTDNSPKFLISVSIQFGFFSIKFSGTAFLKGEQPSLPFFLNLIEFKSGSSVLLRKSLKEPVDKEKLFFSLIASGKSGEWLSARGQGGALFLWLRN